ncbi:hypothetical protein CGCVW01_v004695, partial [Colletotrichum viniferum]
TRPWPVLQNLRKSSQLPPSFPPLSRLPVPTPIFTLRSFHAAVPKAILSARQQYFCATAEPPEIRTSPRHSHQGHSTIPAFLKHSIASSEIEAVAQLEVTDERVSSLQPARAADLHHLVLQTTTRHNLSSLPGGSILLTTAVSKALVSNDRYFSSQSSQASPNSWFRHLDSSSGLSSVQFSASLGWSCFPSNPRLKSVGRTALAPWRQLERDAGAGAGAGAAGGCRSLGWALRYMACPQRPALSARPLSGRLLRDRVCATDTLTDNSLFPQTCIFCASSSTSGDSVATGSVC